MNSFPEDSIQYLSESWWENDADPSIAKGSLVWAHVQFFSQVPIEIVPTRVSAEDHSSATLEARPLRADGGWRPPAPALPVAGLPKLDDADAFAAYRVKKRPCLVVGSTTYKPVPKVISAGMPKRSIHEFTLVAPFYSQHQSGHGGYNPEFVERIRHAEWSRYFWDMLPISQGKESILRLDQIQPLGLHWQSHEKTGFRLCKEAISIMDEWLRWLLFGVEEKTISTFKVLLAESTA